MWYLHYFHLQQERMRKSIKSSHRSFSSSNSLSVLLWLVPLFINYARQRRRNSCLPLSSLQNVFCKVPICWLRSRDANTGHKLTSVPWNALRSFDGTPPMNGFSLIGTTLRVLTTGANIMRGSSHLFCQHLLYHHLWSQINIRALRRSQILWRYPTKEWFLSGWYNAPCLDHRR